MKTTIDKIVERAHKNILPLQWIDKSFIKRTLVAVDMDFNMKWESLINADNFNFAHDLMGIISYYDPIEGSFRECFMPRCCKGRHDPQEIPFTVDQEGGA